MDRTRAAAAVDEAAAMINTPGGGLQVHIAADADAAEVIESGRYCPAPVPCLGRPAVTVAVPVRVVAADTQATQRVGERVGDVTAVYCPLCRTMRADQAPAA